MWQPIGTEWAMSVSGPDGSRDRSCAVITECYERGGLERKLADWKNQVRPFRTPKFVETFGERARLDIEQH